MKLNYKKTFYVGLAFFSICIFWQVYDSVITKILIDKFGLNQTWSGVVMALDNILALFMLPLFGGLSDKTNSKFGKRTPYIVIGTVLAAFAFVALSFADNYQTAQITAEETNIVEFDENGECVNGDYCDYLYMKEIMQGAILDSKGVTAIDNENTDMVKENTDNIAKHTAGTLSDAAFAEWETEYGAWQDSYDAWDVAWVSTLAKWRLENNAMLAQKDAQLANQEITQTVYDQWKTGTEGNPSTFHIMQDIVAVDGAFAAGGLTYTEYSYWSDEIFDGVYDVNLSETAWEMTASNPTTFIVFIITLLIALVSMATFRSPAVALMPDVTIKPLRSKANAIINLMGTFGGILAIGILALFGLDNLSYVNYAPAFITVGILMILILAIFLWKVKEPKLIADKLAEDKKWGLDDEKEAKKKKDEPTEELSKEKRKSLTLILVSVFLWFLGYNAVTTKLSDYAPKVLGMGYSTPLLIAQGAALLAFIPIGILATKIGRRKTILIGITLLTICFGTVYFINVNASWVMYIIFAFTGIGWATINVNSYPMVVELSKGSNIGKYTGYYYTFSMAAQIITPIFSGFLMDLLETRKVLFPYATLFVAAAFITMFFVKHGDAQIAEKKNGIEHFDVEMD